jgi:hypothetical protein
MVKGQDPVFKALLNKEIKVKYSDEGHIRSVGGIVTAVNNFYIVLERGDRGPPMFINHSVISKIIPVDGCENSDDDSTYK